ncbi:transposase [Sporolactobacillus terrae]|uniref:transposase n=1 Tax=Sporolactobacillus terrae TaxID=269673 RepID=UPI001260E653
MDDFAFRKGHTYGVLICDLCTHRVLDILENREAETIKKWFEDHSEVCKRQIMVSVK